MLLSVVYAVVRLLVDLVAVRLRSDGAIRLELIVLRQEECMLRWRPTTGFVSTAAMA